MVSKHRTDKYFVTLNNCYHNKAHFDTNLSQCFSKDFLNSIGVAASASFRARTTISILPIECCCNLKLSRTVRLTLLRSTAFLIIFFAIAKPTLGWPKLFWTAKSVKYRSVDLAGSVKTFLNSAAFFNLNCGGNFWLKPVTQPLVWLFPSPGGRSIPYGHRPKPFFYGNRGF